MVTKQDLSKSELKSRFPVHLPENISPSMCNLLTNSMLYNSEQLEFVKLVEISVPNINFLNMPRKIIAESKDLRLPCGRYNNKFRTEKKKHLE